MLDFHEIGRLPAPDDNCAIATRTLNPGARIIYGEQQFLVNHTILEGHRFAVRPIPAGAFLTSWGFPFGKALHKIEVGAYVCNEAALKELNSRKLPYHFPKTANFIDEILPFSFDEINFRPALPISLTSEQGTFMGYARSGNRGAGTRNTMVLLGTSAVTGGFVRQLESRFNPLSELHENVDGIVAVSHTESGSSAANNRDLLLRTLAGFVVHPNVGAVLIVDDGSADRTNQHLEAFMRENGYPLSDVPHHFLSLTGNFAKDFEKAGAVIHDWINPLNAQARTPIPLSQLKIALQCGGSDAFSGVSGNPLAAWVAKELLRHGGSVNLAETDELIGAEAYVLDRVRDISTVRRFLDFVARFQNWADRYGHSAAGNPSGGNLYRGLYNIYLKSLGAAAKRHPDVRLEGVIEYAAPMTGPGFYFMDSPGNDLESIAGQVASGCNLIFFVTGNGSITNFPFVPTIKIVTTTPRFQLLENDMDVNAGAYLDGTPLSELGGETFSLMKRTASGRRTVGERAGHAQVQIWRDWKMVADPLPGEDARPFSVIGKPLAVPSAESIPDWSYVGFDTARGTVSNQINLILPTSLCSGQIAEMIADQINQNAIGNNAFSRTIALPHTEGCGSSTQDEFIHTILGYAAHPIVKHCLFLEHGCEKTHNAFWRNRLVEAGLVPDDFGWASIQMGGGIQRVTENVQDWFARKNAAENPPVQASGGFEAVRLGLLTNAELGADTAELLAKFTQIIASAGGSVVVPSHDAILHINGFLKTLAIPDDSPPTLQYAGQIKAAGFHIMETPSSDWLETITGLGAAGVECIIALVDRPQPGHPMIPVLQLAAEQTLQTDVDMSLTSTGDAGLDMLLNLLSQTLSRSYIPAANRNKNVGFQVTRGLLGISL